VSLLRVRVFLRSLLLQSGFSDERRQGLGFAWTLDPALRAAHRGDAEGLRSARLRQLGAFNTQPCAAGLVVGACAALEARAAEGDAGAPARAERFKSAVAASLAGSADAFFWGALRPLAAAAAAAAAALGAGRTRAPLLLAAALGLAAFNVPALAARWLGLVRGWDDPDAAVLAAAALPARRAIRAARLSAAALILVATVAALKSPLLANVPAVFAAGAFALGAAASRTAIGPLRLVAAAGLLGAAAWAAVGWTP
jgi:mannose/fructose/N-acetylgalactosamine-specific phosphotransferase system component IID